MSELPLLLALLAQEAGRGGDRAEFELPPLVITPGRVPEPLFDLPQSALVVSRQTLSRRLPAQPADALRDEPGLLVQRTGTGGGAPILRGLIGNQVLYLVDGIRINDGRLFGGPNAFLNQTDVGSLEQIEVLKGPGSVQYGSDALGGVVQLRTREPRFADAFTLGGTAGGRVSSVDHGFGGHLELRAAAPDWSVLGSGSWIDSGDYQGGRGEGELDDTSWGARGGLLKGRFRIADDATLTAAWMAERRSDVERFDQSARNPSGIPRFFSPFEQRSIGYLRADLSNVGGAAIDLAPWFWFHDYDAESVTTSESSSAITRDRTRSDFGHVGGGLQATGRVSDELRLVAGVDGRIEDLSDERVRFVTDKSSGSVTRSIPSGKTPDGSYDSVAAFALADWQPGERWRFDAGVRIESTHLDSDPVASDASAGFTVDDLALDERWNAATWSAGSFVDLGGGFALAGSVATGFRAPTYSDALSFGPFTFGTNVPSPGVDPERSLTAELSPRYDDERLSLRASLYTTWLRDQIGREPTGGFVDLDGDSVQDPGEAAYAADNTGRSRIEGIEAAGEWRFIEEWRLFGAAAFTVGRDLSGDQPMRFIPPFNGRLGAGWTRSDGRVAVDGFVRAFQRKSRLNAADAGDPAFARDPSLAFPSAANPPLRADGGLPGFFTLHLQTRLALTDRARVTLNGDNLLNRRHREPFSRQDAPGIGFTLGFEFDL